MESFCRGQAAAEGYAAAGSWLLDAMQLALSILWLAGWRSTLTGEQAGASQSRWILHKQVRYHSGQWLTALISLSVPQAAFGYKAPVMTPNGIDFSFLFFLSLSVCNRWLYAASRHAFQAAASVPCWNITA